jgi:coenzyme F420-0:L-glutamate ligase/coenzyme F420-1:gamma-L-glutamate ligase
MTLPLTLTPITGFPLLETGDDLVSLILDAIRMPGIYLQDNDIIVITQKIISKVEGRLVDLATVKPSQTAIELARKTNKDARLVELILHESREVLRTERETIIVEHRLGFICANAGIDRSNVETSEGEWVLLLPENPDASAQRLREGLEKKTGLRLGVLIIDTQGRAWRLGVVGMSIGLSGVPALVDVRGKVDLYGNPLRITLIAAADELAAAASLMMGQAAEGAPVVHVRGFPYPLSEGSFSELLRPRQNDLFR